MSARSLFDEVVRASRLQAVIAPYTIRRLLVRSGVVPAENVTAADLERVMPNIEKGLRVFLADDELQDAMREIRALARSPA